MTSRGASVPDLDPPVVYFPDQGDFHAWLEEHHESSDEQWVGFYKKATGKPNGRARPSPYLFTGGKK